MHRPPFAYRPKTDPPKGAATHWIDQRMPRRLVPPAVVSLAQCDPHIVRPAVVLKRQAHRPVGDRLAIEFGVHDTAVDAVRIVDRNRILSRAMAHGYLIPLPGARN